MPHLMLEYTNNLPESVDFAALFARLNASVSEMTNVPIAQVKSRAVPRTIFRVGAGDPDAVFVHLTVSLLEGRDTALQKRLGERLMGHLREAFARAYAERPCDITIEMHEMRRPTYVKDMNQIAKGPGGPAGPHQGD